MNEKEYLEGLINDLCETKENFNRAVRGIKNYYEDKYEKDLSKIYGELLADMQEFADQNPSEEMSFFMGTLLQKIEKRVNEESIDKDVKD
jgi:oligoendopeptidase F